MKSVEDWKQFKDSSGTKPVMLFKHSTRCPVSAEAYDEFMKHVSREASPQVDYALVLVVEHRPVSNAAAEDLGVKHESPQALFIRNGEAVWNTSHWRITADALKEQVAKV